ncbi:hypothetical protein C672_1143 [[Clostridium] bifermentans ATCC 638]|uniref:Uncharacterized protein n=1 Tax=Paraclostridium bifermentans ATCC 638 = DSM 14991 TaxID=1233171 RepID=T4VN64_PARBF|nr:hypothetical protein C672_1143 [[Clostridium] bifermentans ATCC 638] [Paraclostridium bifermentans ATCC 638 = DSM 14991]
MKFLIKLKLKNLKKIFYFNLKIFEGGKLKNNKVDWKITLYLMY